MENHLDSIIVKINSLCKYIANFENKKQNPKQKIKSNSTKQIAKQGKRQVNLYDEIPQEVLDKSYHIFKSSKLLEQYYCEKYFKIWLKQLKQHHFNSNTHNKIFHFNGKKKITDSHQINDHLKSPKQNKITKDLNTDFQESFEEHTEDKSRISLNMGEDDYSQENI